MNIVLTLFFAALFQRYVAFYGLVHTPDLPLLLDLHTKYCRLKSCGLIVTSTSTCMRSLLAILGSVLFVLMPGTVTDAANPESVTVDMTFIDPVTITENVSLRFGLLNVSLANLETIVIAPDDSVTDASGRVVGGVQGAADLTVTATASYTISILVDNVSSATGYTLGTWMCNYDGAGSDSACDSGGYSETTVASATLLVGVTLTGNGSAVLGTDDSTFDVTITYH